MIPAKARAVAVENVREVAVVVRRRRQVLLLRRPATGRWANMWEFPHLAVQSKESDEEAAGRILRDLLGIEAELGQTLPTIRHSVTRFRITLVTWEAQFRSGPVRLTYYKEGRWLSPAELVKYPVSRPQRLLAQELAKPFRQRMLF